MLAIGDNAALAPGTTQSRILRANLNFVPTFRGRILRDVPPIDPGAIRQLGFLIADKVEGPFRLEVDWIKALD